MNDITSARRVLFLCTHNSARSILAEAILNHLSEGAFVAYSAGSQPRPNQAPNPLGLQVLQERNISTEGLYSQSWQNFATAHALKMDLIITVCDSAANEVCPIWPGHPAQVHWGYADPSAGDGSDQEKLLAFRQTADLLTQRLSQFVLLAKSINSAESLVEIAHELAIESVQHPSK